MKRNFALQDGRSKRKNSFNLLSQAQIIFIHHYSIILSERNISFTTGISMQLDLRYLIYRHIESSWRTLHASNSASTLNFGSHSNWSPKLGNVSNFCDEFWEKVLILALACPVLKVCGKTLKGSLSSRNEILIASLNLCAEHNFLQAAHRMPKAGMSIFSVAKKLEYFTGISVDYLTTYGTVDRNSVFCQPNNNFTA